MIKGMHGLVFTPEAEAARTFIKDKLGLAHVDAGDGWLIFDVPKGEFAVHPGTDTHHEISFWCDDIDGTISSGPHHQDSGESKIRESTAGGSRKPSFDGKACGCSSKHLCGLTAWNT